VSSLSQVGKDLGDFSLMRLQVPLEVRVEVEEDELHREGEEDRNEWRMKTDKSHNGPS